MPSGKHRKFDKLGLFYILALSAIALSIIISQFVVQRYIGSQQDDSRTINVAGRQRMLSQKISKLALQIGQQNNIDSARVYAKQLRDALNLWTSSHQALLQGDTAMGITGKPSEQIKEQYESIMYEYQQIVTSAQKIDQLINDPNPDSLKLKIEINNILSHESNFLEGMDAIVFEYDREANEKVDQLRNLEIILLIFSLLVILIELIFIFRPIARNVRRTVDELIDSEGKSIEMASELSRLYEELVKSYQDLESVSYVPETPLVYATMKASGDFLMLSSRFRNAMEWKKKNVPLSFVNLLKQNGYRDEFVIGLMDILDKGLPWTGEVKLTDAMGDFIWLELFIIPSKINQNEDYKIIARNITDFKEAKIRSREINSAKIEQRVKEQQYRSVLILEGQEEERQRLGREIHDGLGQMLTALKLSLESLTPDNSIHTKKRLTDTKELLKSTLREVRRLAFNLTPTSLSDFGVVPAIRKFCQEITALSGVNVQFENSTRFVNRLESHIENNIYRIVQEAVNNAIKYAKTKEIKVSINHTPKELNISVQDHGSGFDYEKLKNSDYFQRSGHGIFNMKERTAFINGIFKLKTKPGSGTKIRISIPLD